MSELADPPRETSALSEQLQQLLRETTVPLTFAELKKAIDVLYPKGTKKVPKPDKPSKEAVQAELDAALLSGTAFAHEPASGKNKRYAGFAPPPPPSPNEVVQVLVTAKLDSGPGPFTLAELAKKPKSLGKDEFSQALGNVINELTLQGRLFEHPPFSGNNKRYGTVAPPPPTPPKEIVLDLVTATLKTGPGPFSQPELAKKPKSLAKDEFSEALGSVINELTLQGKLFEHPPLSGSTKRYATVPPPPPPWYKTPAYAKPFDTLLKAAQKVLDVKVEPADVVFAELQQRLGLASSNQSGSKPSNGLATQIIEIVERWAEEHKTGCPFHELRQRLPPDNIPIGTFHDQLRALHHEKKIILSGWSQSLWEMPKPELGLFISDKVMYYANPGSWK